MPTTNEFRRRAILLLLSLSASIFISATAYICAWANYRNVRLHGSAYFTKMELEKLRKDLKAYKETTGKWPARLMDLRAVKEKEVRLDEAGDPVDSWGRPFHYRVEADGYLLYSYGRDGKPGGFGEDADLYAGQADADIEVPTLRQFTGSPDAGPALIASIMSGVAVFPLFLLNAQERAGQRPSLAKILVTNAVTALFAVLAAVMISTLHIMPGGH